MTLYKADLSQDVPLQHCRKRIVFYRSGLKIYGLIPYILCRRLKGQFISNAIVCGMGAIAAPTRERNYTVIPYLQKPELSQALLSWLLEGAGFEWAIAGPEDWNKNLLEPNIFKSPPQVWVPAESDSGWREGFEKLLRGVFAPEKLLGGSDVG